MTYLEALAGLNLTLEIGAIRLNKLLQVFATPQDIFNVSQEKLMRVEGIGAKIAAKIKGIKKEEIEKELKETKSLGLKIVTSHDPDYPQNLKNIPDAPIVLYVKGELKQEDNLSLGIVGSRRASFYGLESAQTFARDLAGQGFTIVSGMARGVDTSAHRGALKSGGRTIAVIGSGFNYIYPEENKELAEEISRQGAVVSEFPLNARPFPQNFPRRNRVISGLSLGVLVVEAAKNSGALITADFALEQGREVFALPGKADAANSFGTNNLIKQGAKLVTGIEDILEEFNLPPQGKPEIQGKKEDDEFILDGIISEKPIHLDEIADRSRLPLSDLYSTLLKLQMNRVIKQLPGNQFVRSTR